MSTALRDVPRRRSTTPTTVVALAALAVGAGAELAGNPWVLPVVVVGLVVASAATRTSWALALATGVLVPLALLAGVMAAMPLTGLPLVPGLTVSMLVLGLAAVVHAVAAGGWRPPDAAARMLAAGAAVVPSVVGAAAVVGHVRDAGVTWAVWNDGMLHFFGTRGMLRDGGLDLEVGNRDPLANELLSLLTAPGRAGVPVDELLAHDAGRQALTVVLLLVATSVVTSVLVARAVSARHPRVRAVVAVVAGVLPWTWFVSGFALRYGFVNALVAVLALVATWLVWTEARSAPVWASGVLMLAAVALLAAWGLPALVPAGLGAWVIVRHRREILGLRGGGAVAWLACLAFSAAYALLVALRSVQPSGTVGLSGEGEFFSFAPVQAAAIAVLLLVAAVVAARTSGDRWDLVGVVITTVAVAMGLVVVLRERTGPDVVLWGYYAQKYAWVATVLGVVLVARLMATCVSVDLRRLRDKVASPLVVVGAALAAMAIVPPSASPLQGTGWLGLQAVVPAATIVDGRHGESTDDLGYLGPPSPLLFALAAAPHPVLLSGATDDAVVEQWLNDWAVQLAADRGEEVSRADLNGLDLRTPVDLCEALRGRPTDMTVWSRDTDTRETLDATCPDVSVRVVPGPPA
jgi:hypothetical protein